ncbi:hypothetical protein AB0L75_23705 [Streptomyces sp. NPDC052101]|uniref:hypothetical protein n=1 Tax=Streptomyces sp. NPDC052101 TaxID=3155763 RepID=UPI003446FFD9
MNRPAHETSPYLLQHADTPDSQILGDADKLRMILPAVGSDYPAVESHCHVPSPLPDCPSSPSPATTPPK